MTELEALQTTLEAEHAAVYVYGLLGSRTSQSAEPELYLAFYEHPRIIAGGVRRW